MRRWSNARIFTALSRIWCAAWMRTPRRKIFCTICLVCARDRPPLTQQAQASATRCATATAPGSVRSAPRTAQNEQRLFHQHGAPFANEPDTDWSLRHNQLWAAESQLTRWRDAQIAPLPLQIDGALIAPDPGARVRVSDPSRPAGAPYRFAWRRPQRDNQALDARGAASAGHGAPCRSPSARSCLRACAEMLAARRGELIGVMAARWRQSDRPRPMSKSAKRSTLPITTAGPLTTRSAGATCTHAAGHGVGHTAVELPAGDSMRRGAGRADGRQHRNS